MRKVLHSYRTSTLSESRTRSFKGHNTVCTKFGTPTALLGRSLYLPIYVTCCFIWDYPQVLPAPLLATDHVICSNEKFSSKKTFLSTILLDLSSLTCSLYYSLYCLLNNSLDTFLHATDPTWLLHILLVFPVAGNLLLGWSTAKVVTGFAEASRSVGCVTQGAFWYSSCSMRYRQR